MSVRVYACAVVDKKSNKFLGFRLAEDWVAKEPFTAQNLKRKMGEGLKHNQTIYGKVFIVERGIEY